MLKEMGKMEKNLKERFMLEGALGYIAHLNQEIRKGNLKTIEEISNRLNDDGLTASGALSLHLEQALKIAGFETGLFSEPTIKETT